jgi:hypothetical protein
MRLLPPPPADKKPEWVQESIPVPDPGRFPPKLPSPIGMTRLDLKGPGVCSARVWANSTCHRPSWAVLQLPNGERLELCRTHLEERERRGA